MNRVRTLAKVGVLAVIAVLGFGSRASAVFLDEARLFKLTGLFYTQERVAVQSSSGPEGINGGGTQPPVGVGQLKQIRNFANPVLEGNLNKFLGTDPFLKDFSFRFAGRFVYDGIYDLGSGQFARGLRAYTQAAKFMERQDSGTVQAPGPAPFFQGTKPVETVEFDSAGLPRFTRPCGTFPFPFSPLCPAGDPNVRAARIRNQEIFDPRKEFAEQAEAWEVYLNLAKGPLFVRLGRQNLSWGESDGQRLLDDINPLNRFFGLPFDEDLDEQRIPLWMVRANLQVISSLGPLSSTGLEAFWVPGVIDTTQNPFNIGGNHPYAAPSGCDPQAIANAQARANTGGTLNPLGGCLPASGGLIPDGTIKTVIYERLPPKNINNSRFGARVVGVLMRDYTFSLGAYQSYADIPQPRVHYTDLLSIPVGSPLPQPFLLPSNVVAEVTHGKETILGGTLSFFQPYYLPGVVRAEAGYFMNEPAYVDIANKGVVPTVPDILAGTTPFLNTFVPKADYVRWVFGYDIFQLNIPIISRTNNVVLVNQWFAEYNLSSTDKYEKLLAAHVPASIRDPDRAKFAYGQPQPDRVMNSLGEDVAKLTPIPRFNSLGNNTIQAFMMHGLLVPQLTFVWSPQGWFSVLPNVTYRIRDDLLIKVGYSGIYGKFFAGGFFRDRDQVGVRLSYLIS